MMPFSVRLWNAKEHICRLNERRVFGMLMNIYGRLYER